MTIGELSYVERQSKLGPDLNDKASFIAPVARPKNRITVIHLAV